MSGAQTRTPRDARQQLRRRRERRTDHVFEIPFNERVDVRCGDCGEEKSVLIATNDPATTSPTFSTCWTWDCDAFHKFVHDGPVPEPEPVQGRLDQFATDGRGLAEPQHLWPWLVLLGLLVLAISVLTLTRVTL